MSSKRIAQPKTTRRSRPVTNAKILKQVQTYEIPEEFASPLFRQGKKVCTVAREFIKAHQITPPAIVIYSGRMKNDFYLSKDGLFGYQHVYHNPGDFPELTRIREALERANREVMEA